MLKTRNLFKSGLSHGISTSSCVRPSESESSGNLFHINRNMVGDNASASHMRGRLCRKCISCYNFCGEISFHLLQCIFVEIIRTMSTGGEAEDAKLSQFYHLTDISLGSFPSFWNQIMHEKKVIYGAQSPACMQITGTN